MNKENILRCDVMILGSGAAGLSVALSLPEHLQVVVLSKTAMRGGSSLWAQGGIAAVLADEDSLESHVQDTLRAGAGLCNETTVRHTVERGRDAIEWLAGLGVRFDSDPAHRGHYHLTREGGHSHRRIVHAADATGVALMDTLLQRSRGRSNIRFLEHHMAIDLIRAPEPGPTRIAGLYAIHIPSGEVVTCAARCTLLATGGASKVYLYTSNPDIATGDGIAMAWRAGCRIANLEFNQFHPTCLYHPAGASFLISEAIRGEGGLLLRQDQTRFMPDYDERAELAPRDVVARAIDLEMKRSGAEHVWLDVRHLGQDRIQHHFPTIHERLLSLGIDMTRALIPVVPAAHYTCGGIVTDLDARTDLPGLWAVGEATCTGLHGANRMASNSLLECLVFGRQAALDIIQQIAELPPPQSLAAWDHSLVQQSEEEVVIRHNWGELRSSMWNYVGIVRSDRRLQGARRRVDLLKAEADDHYRRYLISPDLIELRNLTDIADLMVTCAARRRESRGLHYNLDCPMTRPDARDTVLEPSRSLPT